MLYRTCICCTEFKINANIASVRDAEVTVLPLQWGALCSAGCMQTQVVLEKQEIVSRRRPSFSCFCSWCGRGLFSVLCIVNSSYPGKQTELFSIPLQAKGLCTSLSLSLSLLCVYLPDLNPGSRCISLSHWFCFAFIFNLVFSVFLLALF